MSTGRLKASTNRVRTSVALNTHSIWTKTIGMEQDQAGSNAAVEASLNAPSFGGGRAARRAAAAEVVEKTGGFDSTVNNYSSLLSLARSQGAIGGQNRGACKTCGQLGHLTKQCRNHLSTSLAGAQAGQNGDKQLLASVVEEEELSSDLSGLTSSSDSDSDTDSEEEKRRKEKERKRKHKDSSKSKKHKRKREHESSKSKSKKSKHKKSTHKHKRRRQNDSSGFESD